jgi:hypothetical protein
LILNSFKFVFSTDFSFSSLNTLVAIFSISLVFHLSSFDIEFSIHDQRDLLLEKSVVFLFSV